MFVAARSCQILARCKTLNKFNTGICNKICESHREILLKAESIEIFSSNSEAHTFDMLVFKESIFDSIGH